jgi:hypothetical protein
MTRLASLIAAAAFVGWAAAPAAAQDQYPQQYPQQYQEPYQQPYPQQYPQPAPGYGYDQQYGGPDQGANALGSIVDSLIGNRYDVSYRQAIHRCADAAVQRARYDYGSGYRDWNDFVHVTGITDVQRRTLVIRVKGMIGLGRWHGYGNGNGYGGGRGAGRRDLSFRCDVDYGGNVRNVRIESPYRY